MPIWGSPIKSPLDNKTYVYRMVGNSPFVKEANPSTTVPTDVIPVKFVFTSFGNATFDPTAKDPTCLPSATASPNSLFLGSPIFQPHAYSPGGTYIGAVQYVDGYQRENFARYTINPGAPNPGYHVKLSAIGHAKVTITVNGGNIQQNGCTGQIGELDYSSWDSYVQGTLLPQLKSSGVSPTHLPIFLFYNVVLTDQGSCCILGYHGSYSSPSFGGAVQTYSVADYDSSNAFTNLQDIGAISHEIGEWMDDPFGNNATPAWGHTGQVAGCQNNLENGDPLSGSHVPIPITMPDGITYHAQELAFRDWFYRTNSLGLHGWYSSNGSFTSSAGPVCH